jgi:predicted PurR-regulated permease PerM
METKSTFDISWRTLWRIFIFVVLMVAVYLAREAISVLLVAIVLALGLDPIVSWFEKRKISRLLGTVIVFILLALFLSGLVYLVLPIITSEISVFLVQFNKAIRAFFGIGLNQGLIENIHSVLNQALNFLGPLNISLGGAVSALFTKLVLVLATILISFYLSIEKDGTEKFLKAILPDIFEIPTLTVFERFKVKIRRWFSAQIVLSLIVGTVVALGLWLMDVRYFLILGLLAAALEIVPIIGPVLSGATMFLVASVESFTLGLYVLLFAFLVQQLENHILIPIVMGKTMKLHPAIVIFSLLAGGHIAGFVGILLAVPLAVLLQETLVYIAEKKRGRARLDI